MNHFKINRNNNKLMNLIMLKVNNIARKSTAHTSSYSGFVYQ